MNSPHSRFAPAHIFSSLGKLETLEFVLSRSEELLVPSQRFRKLMKKFAKQGGFKLLPSDDAIEEPGKQYASVFHATAAPKRRIAYDLSPRILQVGRKKA
jgi:hypothetical protein